MVGRDANQDNVRRDGMNRGTVNCELVWREISNYLEGEVDAELRTQMEQHFSACKQCASVLEGTRNVIRLYGDERMMEVPAGFGSRLEKRLAQKARPRNRWLTWEAWLVPVAAMALIAGGLWWARSWEGQRIALSQMQRDRELAAKNIPPDMVVLVTADSKIFHVAGCSFIHGKEVKSLTAKEALDKGYAPCTRCLRKYLVAEGAPRDGPVVALDADDDDEPGGQ
jgi:hypothetical protein